MLQPVAKVECFKLIIISNKDHQLLDSLMDIVLLGICLFTKPLIAIEGI